MIRLRSRLDPLAIYYYVLAAVVVAPLLVIVLVSLTPSSFLQPPSLTSGLSLRWYQALLGERYFIDAFWKSLYLGLAASGISLVLGTGAAYALTRFEFRGRQWLDLAFLSPLVVPLVITGVAMLQFLASLKWNGSFQGLLVGHVVITAPYTIRLVGASLRGVDPHLEMAAMNLGASWPRAVLATTLPLIGPGLLAAAVFAFLVSFDNLTVSIFLAGPTFRTLPVQIFSFVSDQNSPLIAAVSTTLIAFSLALMTVLERVFGVRRVLG